MTNIVDIVSVRMGLCRHDIENAEKIAEHTGLETKAAVISRALAHTAWLEEQRAGGAEVLLRQPDGKVDLVVFPD